MINQLYLLGKALPSLGFLGNASNFSLFLTAVTIEPMFQSWHEPYLSFSVVTVAVCCSGSALGTKRLMALKALLKALSAAVHILLFAGK